jgi:integrase
MSRPSAEKRNERGQYWLDRRDASPYWQIVWYDADAGRCRYESTKTAIRSNAEVILAKRVLGISLDQTDAQDKTPLTAHFEWPLIAEVFDCYLGEIRGTAGEAQARYAKAHFKACFGERATIDDVYSIERQQEYYDSRVEEADIAAATVARELNIFRSAVHTFHAVATTLPVLPLIARVEGAGRARERWLLLEEVAAVLAAAEFPHINLFIRLALETAGRAGALLDLTWRQVDFPGLAMNLSCGGPNEETNKRRVRVPIISSTLLEALEYAHSVRRTDYVIEYGGYAINCIRKGFATAVAEAGIADPVTGKMRPLRSPEEITPNVLRHTAATWMAKRGVPLKEIADYLGHTTTRMVEKHYAHLHPDWQKRARAALGAEIATLDGAAAPALLVRRERARLRAAAANTAETPQKHRTQRKGVSSTAANPLMNMVEPVGIEPTTSTMPL